MEVHVERHVRVYGDKLPREEGKFLSFGEFLPHPLLGDLFHMVVQLLHGPVFLDQGNSGLFPYAGDAGHVVGRVAGETEDIDDFVRGDAELLTHSLFPDDIGAVPRLSGFVHPDQGGDQLHEILVARDDHGHHPFLLRPAGQRPDDVVRLIAGLFNKGRIESADHFFKLLHLRGHILRHLLACGFVVLVEDVAECRLLRIERYGNVCWFLFLQNFQEGCDKAEDGARVFAFAVDERTGNKGEIGAVRKCHAVEKKEPFGGTHGESPRSVQP